MAIQDCEKLILNDVNSAFGAYLKLADRDSCDDTEFCEGVHRLQNVIAMRIARRENPEFWKVADGGWSRLHSNPNQNTQESQRGDEK